MDWRPYNAAIAATSKTVSRRNGARRQGQRADAVRSIAIVAARAGIAMTLAQLGVLADLGDQRVVSDAIARLGSKDRRPTFVEIETEAKAALRRSDERGGWWEK